MVLRTLVVVIGTGSRSGRSVGAGGGRGGVERTARVVHSERFHYDIIGRVMDGESADPNTYPRVGLVRGSLFKYFVNVGKRKDSRPGRLSECRW